LPKELSAKVFFDQEQSFLQFRGRMTTTEVKALKTLSLSPADPVNIAYLAAIDSLVSLQPDQGDLWIEASDVDQLFDNPTTSVKGHAKHIAHNLKRVTAKIYNYFRLLLSEVFAVQQFSESLGISPASAKKLLKTYKLFGKPTALPLFEDFTGDDFVASPKPLTHKEHAHRHVGYYWLHRVAIGSRYRPSLTIRFPQSRH
jgi:hypothetical protein